MKKQMLSILEGNKTNLSSRWVWRPAGCRDIPHPVLLGQEEKQPCFTRDVEDPRVLAGRATSGMTTGLMGFTLIELLVVVLIIGILAAVAVPKYEQAVLKSRAAQVIPYLKALKNAEEVYYLANGEYTADIDSLAVDTQAPSGWSFGLLHDNTEKVEAYYRGGGKWTIGANLDHRAQWAGVMFCWAAKDQTKYEQVCKSMGNPLPGGEDGYGKRWYIQQ